MLFVCLFVFLFVCLFVCLFWVVRMGVGKVERIDERAGGEKKAYLLEKEEGKKEKDE